MKMMRMMKKKRKQFLEAEEDAKPSEQHTDKKKPTPHDEAAKSTCKPHAGAKKLNKSSAKRQKPHPPETPPCPWSGTWPAVPKSAQARRPGWQGAARGSTSPRTSVYRSWRS